MSITQILSAAHAVTRQTADGKVVYIESVDVHQLRGKLNAATTLAAPVLAFSEDLAEESHCCSSPFLK
jgi:hypothetical protein